jgi:glutathione S-transferase
MTLKLYIGNYNYSSWSLRAWVLLQQSGLAFETVKLRFDSFATHSQFKQSLKGLSPVGKVPVLVDAAHTPALAVWDTLAIAEYVAELAAKKGQHLWPVAVPQRARARSICAEMHAGFAALRSAFPMNIEASLPQVGALVLRDQAAVAADLARLVALWGEALDAHAAGHADQMLFGAFSVADAYFAPVCLRIRTYALPVPPVVAAYVQRVLALPSVQAWVQAALAEQDFLDFEEPYRLQPSLQSFGAI